MKSKAYDILYKFEEDHWWFIVKRRLYSFLLDGKKNINILDAGCGTGGDLNYLKKYGNVIGVDISEKALLYSKRRGHKVARGDVNDLPFKDNHFDLVVASDSLYHRWVDDKKAVREFYRVLKGGGLLLVNTAAYNFLWSKHDEAVMTKIRYTKRTLNELLKINNFVVKDMFYWNSFLFPFRVVSKVMNFGNPESSDLSYSSFMNKILLFILDIEVAFVKSGIRLPFGTSIMCLAEKR